MPTTPARIAATLTALAAWSGLAIQFLALVGRLDSGSAAFWEMGRYFTVLANLVVALVFSGIAAGSSTLARSRVVAGTAMAIMLVGVVYAVLLRGMLSLTGGDAIANVFLHVVTPALVPLYWIAFVPKGGLRPRDAWVWMLFPAAYVAYALVRGAIEGRYAYPFLDVGAQGWGRTLATIAAMGAGFVAVGHAWVALDRGLGGR